jgi:hypothetical protein
MKKVSIISFVLIINGFLCQGQKLPTFDITTGGGFTEAIHLGCKIQITQKNQIGFYYGNSLMLYRYSYNSYNIDHQFHFGKTSDFSQRPVWFFRQGLSYSIDNAAYSEIKYLFVSLCLGREFNISPKVGFNLDLGLSRTLMEKERIKDPSIEPWFDVKMIDLVVFPNLRLQFFYSF